MGLQCPANFFKSETLGNFEQKVRADEFETSTVLNLTIARNSTGMFSAFSTHWCHGLFLGGGVWWGCNSVSWKIYHKDGGVDRNTFVKKFSSVKDAFSSSFKRFHYCDEIKTLYR